MKKTIERLWILLALAALVFALAACTSVKTEDHPIVDGTTADAAEMTEGDATEPKATEPAGEGAVTVVTTAAATDGSGCAHVWDSGKIIEAADCSTKGVKLFTCTVCGAKKTEAIPKTDSHTVGFTYLASEPTATKAAQKAGICSKCGKSVYVNDASVTYSSYKSQVDACKTKINGYTDSQFGGTKYSTMSTSKYNAPTASPKSNEHPRLLFNSTTLSDVKAAMGKIENSAKLQSVISVASDYTSGIPSGNTQGYDGEDYKEEILQTIRAKAFLYRMTGVTLYGYDAIRMMKEFITSFKIADTSDPCRRYGEVMFATAQVYDWCYDLLTSADKKQFIIGVEKKCGPGMEVGFPPSKQGAISGHGCERQILRDYLAFAIAIYDDEPTWYKYIAGRVYQEYVPVRNEYYKAGYYPQGISTYLPIRFGSDLWSAWLLEAATGKFPYNASDMKQVMRSAYSHIMKGVSDNGKTVIFSEGDHQGRSGKEAMKQMALPSMISAYLFNDPVAMSWADFADYSYFTSTYYMILKSKGTTGTSSTRYDGLDLILYNGGWLGQMIAHSSWDGNSASVYMKIGNRTTANHDHADSGSFQIFYKSLLAGDSGYYDKYESDHHSFYHQATVAHNSIVLKDGNTILGQKQPSETTSLSTWQGSSYKMGTTTGFAYGYSDTAKTKPTYAYIAGDIADAYCATSIYSLFGTVLRTTSSSSNMERCDRRMLAVYDTGNSDVPMYFFVYDNMTAKDSKYQKVFLLHTVTEPSISGKTATVVNGDGKLVLQNVVGNCTLSKVGGSKPANWTVGSKTYALTKDDKTDGYWGRLEVATASGSKSSIMLNAMYVCDKSKSPSGQTATAITNSSSATGTVMGKVGSTTKTVSASSDGGLLVFTAPAGTVTLTPQ